MPILKKIPVRRFFAPQAPGHIPAIIATNARQTHIPAAHTGLNDSHQPASNIVHIANRLARKN